MNRIYVAAVAALLAAPHIAGMAQSCSKTSPAHTVALLELYTSEGCDSCPPADKFVSSLYKTSGLNADQLIPISLHVDYWDYIGWKDSFAKPLFTERQRWLAEVADSRNVYTPEIFIGGHELRNWRGGIPAAVKRINETPAQADIRISLDKSTDNKLRLNLVSKSAQPGKLYFALTENSLVSNVKAGENRGVTLQHDYVAREWGAPINLMRGISENFSREINLPANAANRNLAITAFVQSGKGAVLQALSLPVCKSM
ncbi:DUF1223 domain-containing protein [Undibacterium terreum]|uniref:Secreted protein n=1 Tax=Undibacterium terreum TaxID=1224302 RepID=A0A916XGR2_9BURK|nr:DUF1223 domain-containing protein [Undibacterium terreum]GGC70631.1 hypothetical protein GCM10011396_17190 [Undibacterium terreum]